MKLSYASQIETSSTLQMWKYTGQVLKKVEGTDMGRLQKS